MFLAQVGGFTFVDWGVVALYFFVVILIGALAGRSAGGKDDFFLAGRGMPMWAVAISVLATSLSAATFIGGPQQAYTSNLTYLFSSVGGLIAILIVAVFFLPAFYRAGVTSIYELLGHKFGGGSRCAGSAMFMIGRIFASGARLFMVAIPFALIVFGDMTPNHLIVSIIIIAVVAAAYTMVGGIRAVIWTDVLQAVVLVLAVGIAVTLLLQRIPISLGEIVTKLGETPVGDANKLTLIDFSRDPSNWHTFWTAIFAWSLFNLAAFGTDQDLVQRMLTCRSARRGGLAAIVSNLIGWPVVALFLTMGLLLFVFYGRPDIMGEVGPKYAIEDSRKVFLEFILYEIGPGMRGLMIAGLFAAAMSSLDSALNAMASTTVADFYRPLRARRRLAAKNEEQRERLLGRIAILFWAVVLAGFACICVRWQAASGQTLVNFALGVMVFAYSGLLAVFVTALFTRRGNTRSVLLALMTGFVVVLAMQPGIWATDWYFVAWIWMKLNGRWAEWMITAAELRLAMPWQMVIASTLAFIVCCLGRRKEPADADSGGQS